MPRFTVLRFGAGETERLMLEPVRSGSQGKLPRGVELLGVLQLPMSSQLVSLSPPILDVPSTGRLALSDIIHGRVAAAGVIWRGRTPAAG